MSANSLLQYVTQALFLLIFVVVAVKTVRRPWPAHRDTALLFGVLSLIIAESWVTTGFHLELSPLLLALAGSLLMAIPYLLLRLVNDFAGVPPWRMRLAVAGLAAAVVGLFALAKPFSLWLMLIYVAYFVAVVLYAALAFARSALGSRGVTRRRTQAAAWGSLALGLDILMRGMSAALPKQTALWTVFGDLCALGSGLGYFVGFAPPQWLRRAWQEPELRAFLGRVARLPRLHDTHAIVLALEHGAAASLGAPRASVCLWDDDRGVLWAITNQGQRFEVRPGEMIGGRAFAIRRPLFWPDAARIDPDNAEVYHAHHANALIAVPITAGDKHFGVLVVYASRPSIFAEDDLSLAQLLADQAAVILESHALIEEAAHVRAREVASRLKDDFLSAAAHDLKTPLTALIAQAQLLERRAQRDPSAPADVRGVQRIVREGQRLKRVVLDVLDVAGLEQGDLVRAREALDLVAAAHDACTRHSSDRHHCTLDAAEPVVGHYDPNRIAQLIDNLLDNAVKYSPNGGEICVRVWREGSHAHLAVEDRGIGIPAGDIAHLFDRFHRGANVDDRRFAGMGLGLFICRGIAEQHGGRIEASSPGLGRGSRFHVVLPLPVSALVGQLGDDGRTRAGAAVPA